jgi:catechol 2,3-dioxygenase
MKAHYLGHVVFYVEDIERSLAFYRDLLGFHEVGRIFNGAAAAMTSGVQVNLKRFDQLRVSR